MARAQVRAPAAEDQEPQTAADDNEAPEAQGGDSSDSPILDLSDAAVKRMIKLAKARGYVTMDELNKVLPSEEVTSEAIEDTLAMLSEMGVNVVESEEDAEGGEVAVREETAVVETTKEAAYDRTDRAADNRASDCAADCATLCAAALRAGHHRDKR